MRFAEISLEPWKRLPGLDNESPSYRQLMQCVKKVFAHFDRFTDSFSQVVLDSLFPFQVNF